MESDDNNETEEFPDYKPNGYHPVHLGYIIILIVIQLLYREIVDSKYVILKKLGWGHFSTVWLALSLADKNLYALKFQKSAKKYTDSAFDEEGILKVLAENHHNPEWVKSVRQYYKGKGEEDGNLLEVTRDHTHNL